MATNYDKIAKNYDLISRLVFGKALVEAQVCLLKYVSEGSRILIVGGGTGWILEEFAKVHSQGLKIDYIESSAKMITLSKQRNYGANEINFINFAVEHYTTEEKYDVIMTPFFFDNFRLDKCREIFTKLDSFLKNDGVWLYVDFVYDENNGQLWQKILLKLMYFFFRVTTRIETQELISMNQFFDPLYYKMAEISHYHNFIKSIAFKKR
jgi:ubiquinone/menaquinone biosynthesis C-methylase UbiE